MKAYVEYNFKVPQDFFFLFLLQNINNYPLENWKNNGCACDCEGVKQTILTVWTASQINSFHSMRKTHTNTFTLSQWVLVSVGSEQKSVCLSIKNTTCNKLYPPLALLTHLRPKNFSNFKGLQLTSWDIKLYMVFKKKDWKAFVRIPIIVQMSSKIGTWWRCGLNRRSLCAAGSEDQQS